MKSGWSDGLDSEGFQPISGSFVGLFAPGLGAKVVVLPTIPFGVNTGQTDIYLDINMNPSTLQHERNLIGNPNMMGDLFSSLVELARRVQRNGRPAIEDPGVRQRLVEIEGFMRTSEKSGSTSGW